MSNIQGLKELSVRLKLLPEEITKKILKKAVYSAAATIRKEAKSNAPALTGTLRRAAYVKFKREDSNNTQAVYIVSFRKGKNQQKRGRDAYYAGMVEFGHRKKNGGIVPGKRYLTNAFNAKQTEAVEAMKRKILVEIEKL